MAKQKPIKWDGRERTAERIADVMPDGTVSWWGGQRGYPRELFIHKRGGRLIYVVERGKLVGANRNGKPCIVRTAR